MNNIETLHEQIVSLELKIDSLTEKIEDTSSLPKKWLRTNEVCKYLSISESQLQVLKNQGYFPVHKVGGTNFYDRNEIDNAISKSDQEVLS